MTAKEALFLVMGCIIVLLCVTLILSIHDLRAQVAFGTATMGGLCMILSALMPERDV